MDLRFISKHFSKITLVTSCEKKTLVRTYCKHLMNIDEHNQWLPIPSRYILFHAFQCPDQLFKKNLDEVNF